MAEARLVKSFERLPAESAYEAILWLAAGGMGTVYAARRKTGHAARLYAIKRTHPHLLDDPAVVALIKSEGWLASRIQHPNVVPVHDVEELLGECLLVMDYVEGVSAEKLVVRSTGAGSYVPAIVRIIADAAAGLQAAHELVDERGRSLGLVHRDVSPSNVIVGADGLARVADFGVAKAATDLVVQTATGVLRGKVAYMAPEYVSTGKLDARSDVFALGIVAWELLCADRLFQGANDAETLRAIVNPQRRAPSAQARALEWADDSVLRALEVDPEQRYETAAAFVHDFVSAAREAGIVGEAADVAAVVREVAEASLATRRRLLREASIGAAAGATHGVTPPAGRRGDTASLVADEVASSEAPEGPTLERLERASDREGQSTTLERAGARAPGPAPLIEPEPESDLSTLAVPVPPRAPAPQPPLSFALEPTELAARHDSPGDPWLAAGPTRRSSRPSSSRSRLTTVAVAAMLGAAALAGVLWRLQPERPAPEDAWTAEPVVPVPQNTPAVPVPVFTAPAALVAEDGGGGSVTATSPAQPSPAMPGRVRPRPSPHTPGPPPRPPKPDPDPPATNVLPNPYAPRP